MSDDELRDYIRKAGNEHESAWEGVELAGEWCLTLAKEAIRRGFPEEPDESV